MRATERVNWTATNGFVWRNEFSAYFVTMEPAPNENTGGRSTAWIERTEWGTAVLLSIVALILFVVRATHAGSLWRDEAESVQSAQMPFGEMLDSIQYSSFPILFPLVLRVHIALFGVGDASLRCFGAAVGIFLLLVIWCPLKQLGRTVPLFSLAAIGLNANFLIAGMSLRGYGLGSLLMLLAFICTVRLLIQPTLAAAVVLLFADFACSQCLFLNLPIVASLIGTAICVLLVQKVRRVWPWALIAFMCALPYAFYIAQFFSSGRIWAKILQVPTSFGLVSQSLLIAWGDISPTVSLVAVGLVAVTFIASIYRLRETRNKERTAERDLVLFGILAVPLAIAASCLFVRLLPRQPETRYFLALTIVIVAWIDLLWVQFPQWARLVRIGVVVAATVWLPFLLWGRVIQAESNSKAVAGLLERKAQPGDLIVVNPWSYGVSFNWYYHGPNRWISVPKLEDHRVHRYDLLREKMESAAPLTDVENEIAEALRSGLRVWLAGQLEVPPPGESPLRVGPAPDAQLGWAGAGYRKAWSQEVGLFLQQHVGKGTPVEMGAGQVISARENFSLYQLEGWQF